MCAGFSQLNAESTGGVKVWICLFLLVTLQMTTALRPIVGTAPTLLPEEKKFFVNHWRENLR